ncbi:MAG: DGQHR domain-containing protein [Bacteroidota bacterium]
MEKYIENIKYIEVKQPIGKLYIANIRCEDLLDIAKFDIRRIVNEEGNELDTYFGIQRKPSPARLKEISEYVGFIDATFPSSIVIAINTYKNIEDEVLVKNIIINNNSLSIRKSDEIAQIIDGQHRLLGLQKAIDDNQLFNNNIKDFELVVTIYVDMDIENQSMVFSTINKAQTKVNKSLVFDLYDLSNSRSPYRTAHNIVRVLNENEKSPLKNKIKMLGLADDPVNETVAQATLVDCIVEYISKSPLKDRDILKRDEKLILGNDRKLFFREWFKEESDIKIVQVVLNYFISISKKWSNPWNDNTILVKSTGIIAFMKFFNYLIQNKFLPKEKYFLDRIITVDEFDEIFGIIDIDDADFNNQNFPSGGIGQSKLKNELISKSGIKSN